MNIWQCECGNKGYMIMQGKPICKECHKTLLVKDGLNRQNACDYVRDIEKELQAKRNVD